VVVDNRGGASTTIGGAAAAQAAPDGYTLLCVHMASIIQTVLRTRLSYGMASFTPIIGIGGYPMALGRVAEVDDPQASPTSRRRRPRVRASPYASGGPGTLGHLTAVRFLKAIEGKGNAYPLQEQP
jgi:tripartite-type tricarboxylate transporter receptor subunit TctC